MTNIHVGDSNFSEKCFAPRYGEFAKDIAMPAEYDSTVEVNLSNGEVIARAYNKRGNWIKALVKDECLRSEAIAMAKKKAAEQEAADEKNAKYIPDYSAYSGNSRGGHD